MLRPCQVRLERLLGLWRGDEESDGYASEPLVFEICMKLRPDSENVLRQNLYPHGDEPPDDISPMISAGYERYRKEARRAARQASKEGK